jgi:hypothetical protein
LPRWGTAMLCPYVSLSASGLPRFYGGTSLFVQSGTEDGHNEVGEVRRAFIQLQPANYAVVGQVFGDAGFGDS